MNAPGIGLSGSPPARFALPSQLLTSPAWAPTLENASNNSRPTMLRFRRRVSANITPATGLGGSILMQVEDTAGNDQDIAAIDFYALSPTEGSEAGAMLFRIASSGALPTGSSAELALSASAIIMRTLGTNYNSVSPNVYTIRHLLTAATAFPAEAGMGFGVGYSMPSSNGTFRTVTEWRSVWADATNGSEDGILRLAVRDNGGISVGDEQFEIHGNSNVISGRKVALATDATAGFLYLPTMPGAPTGVPEAFAGKAPVVIDSVNYALKFYAGGAWRSVGGGSILTGDPGPFLARAAAALGVAETDLDVWFTDFEDNDAWDPAAGTGNGAVSGQLAGGVMVVESGTTAPNTARVRRGSTGGGRPPPIPLGATGVWYIAVRWKTDANNLGASDARGFFVLRSDGTEEILLGQTGAVAKTRYMAVTGANQIAVDASFASDTAFRHMELFRDGSTTTLRVTDGALGNAASGTNANVYPATAIVSRWEQFARNNSSGGTNFQSLCDWVMIVRPKTQRTA